MLKKSAKCEALASLTRIEILAKKISQQVDDLEMDLDGLVMTEQDMLHRIKLWAQQIHSTAGILNAGFTDKKRT